MNPKIKDYLGIAAIVGILLFSLAAWNFSRSVEPASFRSFTVSAEGKAAAVPDIAQFTFGVTTESGLDNVEEAKDENAEKADDIIDYLKDENVDKEDIKTTSFNVYPRYENIRCFGGPCPEPKIAGYTITQTVMVKVRDMDDAGEILSGVVDRGANNVSGLSFIIDDPTKLENEAREEAFEKAKEEAKAIAKAGGFRLGKLISVDEGFYGRGVALSFAEKADGMGGGGVDIPIEPGEQEVRVNITLRYEIK
jgi:uncharacterized protein YggE